MATDALDSPSWSSNARSLVDRESVGALVLTVAIPFLFVHERFQPELAIAVGSTSLEIRLADWAVLAVVAVALITAVRRGTKPLAAGRLLWISGALLLGWLAFAALRPVAMDDAQFDEHLVSYLKFVEYALLAVAVPLVVRRPRDLTLVLLGVVLWSAVATGVALLQLLGSDIFSVSTSGWRYASFLGRHDLAALSALAASLAAARIVTGRGHVPATWLFPLAATAGVLGLVLAGSVAAAGGFAIGAVGLWIAARHRFAPSRRQTAALVATVATVAAGRGDDPQRGARRLSPLRRPARRRHGTGRGDVLAAHGARVHRPSHRAGQSRSSASAGSARRGRRSSSRTWTTRASASRTSSTSRSPRKGNPWGVQNLYIQVLADAGAIGLALLLLVGAAGLVLAWRAAARAPTPWAAGAGLVVVCALLTLGAEWASLGIVAGNPAAGRDVPAARARRSGRGGSGECAGMKTLVTGGGGFIGSNLVRALLAARRRRARPRQLLHREPAESRRARRRGRRGRAAELRTRPQCRARHGGRVPPRRPRVRSPLGSGSADLERGQRRGHAQRPARRPRRGRPPRRVRLLVVHLRQSVRASAARVDGARPDLAVRRREARGRALLRELQPRLPLVRDGGAPLLQRLRTAAGPDVAVRSGRPALHHRDRRRGAGDDLRRRRAVP